MVQDKPRKVPRKTATNAAPRSRPGERRSDPEHEISSQIFDHLLEGCMIIGRDWTYLYVNEIAARHGHQKPENLLGRTMLEIYPGVEHTPVFASYRRCMEERTPQRFESSFTFQDGTTDWYLFSVQPVPEGIFVLSLDISESKRVELKLQRHQDHLQDLVRERTAELQAILDHAPIALWIAHDPECRKITGNAFADRIIMQTTEGANISRSAPSEETPVAYRVLRNGVELSPEELPAQIAAANGRTVTGEEVELVFSDGRRVPMILGATPLFDTEGRPRGSWRNCLRLAGAMCTLRQNTSLFFNDKGCRYPKNSNREHRFQSGGFRKGY